MAVAEQVVGVQAAAGGGVREETGWFTTHLGPQPLAAQWEPLRPQGRGLSPWRSTGSGPGLHPVSCAAQP